MCPLYRISEIGSFIAQQEVCIRRAYTEWVIGSVDILGGDSIGLCE